MRAKTYEAWGEVRTAKEWVEDSRCVVDARTIYDRVVAGFSVEDALTQPQKDVPPLTALTAFGETKTLSAWVRDSRCVVAIGSLYGRISRGWDPEVALTTPTRTVETYKAFGDTKSLRSWAMDHRCIVGLEVLKSRVSRGWSIEEAISEPARQVEIGRQLEAFGESKTLTEWHSDSRTREMDFSTLHLRSKTLPMETALTLPLPAPSFGEQQISEYVTQLGLGVERNVRDVIAPQELDIYVPERNFAIEFNGIYWHAEPFKSKEYHAEKAQAAQEAGIQLVQVWEDDWLTKPELVKEMVAVKLGVSTLPKINARQCSVEEISAQDSRTFLDAFHIQGATNGSVRLGLIDNKQLVALMVFKARQDGTWELVRYASAALVRGGFQKLVKAFQLKYPQTALVSFAALDVSTGSVYEAAGWQQVDYLKPDYMYVYRGRRVHKFNFRKNRFKTDPDLLFDPALTESELARLNNIPRIWDAGKRKYLLTP